MVDQTAMEDQTVQAPSSISATLALSPSNFKECEAVEISLTAVLHASQAITIRTYGTIFNIDLAQRLERPRGNFSCIDTHTNTPLKLQTVSCAKRSAIRHWLNDHDSQYFHTLQPGIPYKFSGPCYIPHHFLAPGHTYRLSFGQENEVYWWQYGLKEDVLISPEQELSDDMFEPSGEPIAISNIEPIEFTVASDWTNLAATISSEISAVNSARSIGTSDPPSVTATLSLNVSTVPGDLTAELSITAVSHAPIPATIWIWPTILNMKVMQHPGRGCGDFTLTHLDTNTSIPTLEMFRTRQDGMVYQKDRYFHTLQPEQPYRFSERFTPAFLQELQLRPGLYRLALNEGVVLSFWKEGTKEEVTAPLGQKPANGMYVASGEPIILKDIEPIEFTIPAGR